jgi:hypothetical protein
MKLIARLPLPIMVFELIKQAGYEFNSWQYWAWIVAFIFVNIAYDWGVKS